MMRVSRRRAATSFSRDFAAPAWAAIGFPAAKLKTLLPERLRRLVGATRPMPGAGGRKARPYSKAGEPER